MYITCGNVSVFGKGSYPPDPSSQLRELDKIYY